MERFRHWRGFLSERRGLAVSGLLFQNQTLSQIFHSRERRWMFWDLTLVPRALAVLRPRLSVLALATQRRSCSKQTLYCLIWKYCYRPAPLGVFCELSRTSPSANASMPWSPIKTCSIVENSWTISSYYPSQLKACWETTQA
jgi:hypothetical protein